MTTAAQKEFTELVERVAAEIGDQPLDDKLEQHLNRAFPPAGDIFRRLAAASRAGIAEGWLCAREAAGIRFGRIIKPGAATRNFSIDVVLMEDIAGPHHSHPGGEIDLIIPETPGATFDGRGEGWLVYGPGSAHRPTVQNGRAIILYFLPAGQITFTKE